MKDLGKLGEAYEDRKGRACLGSQKGGWLIDWEGLDLVWGLGQEMLEAPLGTILGEL